MMNPGTKAKADLLLLLHSDTCWFSWCHLHFQQLELNLAELGQSRNLDTAGITQSLSVRKERISTFKAVHSVCSEVKILW